MLKTWRIYTTKVNVPEEYRDPPFPGLPPGNEGMGYCRTKREARAIARYDRMAKGQPSIVKIKVHRMPKGGYRGNQVAGYDFGLRLKQAMDKHHMTQAEVAKRLKVDRSTVWNWLNSVNVPDKHTRDRVWAMVRGLGNRPPQRKQEGAQEGREQG